MVAAHPEHPSSGSQHRTAPRLQPLLPAAASGLVAGALAGIVEVVLLVALGGNPDLKISQEIRFKIFLKQTPAFRIRHLPVIVWIKGRLTGPGQHLATPWIHENSDPS